MLICHPASIMWTLRTCVRGVLKSAKSEHHLLFRCCSDGNPFPDLSKGNESAEETNDFDIRQSVSKSGQRIKKPTSPTVPHHQEQRSIPKQSSLSDVSSITMVEKQFKQEKSDRAKHFSSDLSNRLMQISQKSVEISEAYADQPQSESSYDDFSEEKHPTYSRNDEPYTKRRTLSEEEHPTYSRNDEPYTGRRTRSNYDNHVEGHEHRHPRRGWGKPPHRSEFQSPRYNYGLSGVGKGPRPEGFVPYPESQGEVLHGVFPVMIALEQGRRTFHKLYVKADFAERPRTKIRKIMALAEEKGVEIDPCSSMKINHLSQNRPHQGVCLDAGRLQLPCIEEENSSLDHSSEQKPRLWVVMAQIQDPMNFGAMLRTCCFLGVNKIITARSNSSALSPVVSKSSAGALEMAPLYLTESLSGFLEMKIMEGFRIFGASGVIPSHVSVSRLKSLKDVSLDQDTILVLGNEGFGMDEEIEALCSHLLTIHPGQGVPQSLDSLNVSVATGIILHHFISPKE